MERKISLSDLRKTVDEAYELVKSVKEGEIDPRNVGADCKHTGITVVLADGTVINKGDTDVKVPMGSIVRVPLASVMFSQNSRDELIKKSGQCPCHKLPHKPAHLPVSAHTIRAFSAMEPTGDPESKWNLYENRMIDLMGTSPELNDTVYETIKKQVNEDGTVNRLAEDGYFLYDDATLAVDLAVKAEAMSASTAQLAMMGATIAADGVNPSTGKIVFDGEIAKYIVAMMAAKGPHKMNTPWLVSTGLPAKASFGGTILGIYPGVMAIAAYGAELNPARVSVRAARAIKHIMEKLDMSVFSSARVSIVKD